MVDVADCFVLFLCGILVGSVQKAYINHILQEIEYVPDKLIKFSNGFLYVLIFLVRRRKEEMVLLCIFISILTVISIIDYKTFEIPPECSIVIGILGCLRLFLGQENLGEYLTGLLVVGVLLFIAYVFTGGKCIGGGDIKLMAAAGTFLGGKNILLALFIGALFGALVHPIFMIFKGKDKVLALGPYLSLGIFIALLCGDKKWVMGCYF